MPTSLRKLCDLRQDADRIRFRDTHRMGYEGLSPDDLPEWTHPWWEAVDDGRLPAVKYHARVLRVSVATVWYGALQIKAVARLTYAAPPWHPSFYKYWFRSWDLDKAELDRFLGTSESSGCDHPRCFRCKDALGDAVCGALSRLISIGSAVVETIVVRRPAQRTKVLTGIDLSIRS